MTFEERQTLRLLISDTVRKRVPVREFGSCIVCCEDFTPRSRLQTVCSAQCSRRLGGFRRYRRAHQPGQEAA